MFTWLWRWWLGAAPGKAPSAAPAEFQHELLAALLNKERLRWGLKLLSQEFALDEVAIGLLDQLMEQVREPKKYCLSVPLALLGWQAGAVCAARGYTTPQEALDAWLDRPADRLSLLNPRFTLAALVDMEDDDGTRWWLILLAEPLSNPDGQRTLFAARPLVRVPGVALV